MKRLLWNIGKALKALWKDPRVREAVADTILKDN